jgi:HSP20 family molecular chaperone IbpA
MTDQDTATAPSSGSATREAPTYVPPTDIYETKDAVVMFLDMPGADNDSLDVTLDKRELTISARSAAPVPQGYSPLHAEYRDGSYERAFTLSDQIDGERIEAVLKDGVLRLTLPKTSPTPAKKIPVKAA